MDYAAGVWGAKLYPKCDQVQNKAIRTFMGVGKFAPLPAVNGDMGWIPVSVRHQLECIKLWNRLVSMSDHRLTKKVFIWDYNMSKRNVKCWSHQVLKILESCQLTSLWQSQSLVDISVCRAHLLAAYMAKWRDNIGSMPKLRLYKVLKETYGTE
jgi:hypothetical protein